jgi:NitT/TauT family transport system substrate-binding protein
MKIKFLCFIIAIGLLSGCNNGHKKNNNNEVYKTTLKLNWIFTGAYVSDALAKKEFAKANNLDLSIEQGGQGLDPLKLVKDNEFGAAAADEILRANDKGADFVIIGVINYDSPTCFISLEKENIKTPQDFVGKTVGLLPFGSTGIVYKLLLKKNNIDESKIKEVTVYPDLKVFVSGKTHQVQPAFVFDETVTLENEGIKFNVLEAKDWGVVYKGPCYFTTANTIKNNPQLVQAFINTIATGMNEAIKEPAKAVQALKELAPEINEKRELQMWGKAIPYYRGYNNQPLTSDVESWSAMVVELKGFNEIKNEPDLGKVLDFSFVDKYYQSESKN